MYFDPNRVRRTWGVDLALEHSILAPTLGTLVRKDEDDEPNNLHRYSHQTGNEAIVLE